jgi:outer membrane protein
MSFQIRRSHFVAATFMALVLAAVFAARAARATAPESAVKISVIDTEKILLSSNTGKKAVADLKKLQDAAENQLKSQQQEIQDLQTKINNGRLSLSQDQLAQLKKQLEDKTIALRRAQDDATRDLTKKRDDMLAAIDQKVMPIINQIGKEMGYTLIFRKFESGLIYADDAIDITALAVQRLDAGK